MSVAQPGRPLRGSARANERLKLSGAAILVSRGMKVLRPWQDCSGSDDANGVWPHSTVTLLARFRGLSTSQPRKRAIWYANSCSGTTATIGCK